jgi:hypothetical protein
MNKKKTLFYLLLFAVLVFICYKYIYKEHRDVKTEEASFSISTAVLIRDFNKDEIAANKMYLDKIIAVSGNISSIDLSSNSLIIDEKFFVIFSNEIPLELQKGTNIIVKGRFIGYDELFDEFKMDQCLIIK